MGGYRYERLTNHSYLPYPRLKNSSHYLLRVPVNSRTRDRGQESGIGVLRAAEVMPKSPLCSRSVPK